MSYTLLKSKRYRNVFLALPLGSLSSSAWEVCYRKVLNRDYTLGILVISRKEHNEFLSSGSVVIAANTAATSLLTRFAKILEKDLGVLAGDHTVYFELRFEPPHEGLGVSLKVSPILLSEWVFGQTGPLLSPNRRKLDGLF